MTAFERIRRIALVILMLISAAACTAGTACAQDFAECDIPAVCRISSDIPDSMDLDFTYTLKADDKGSPMPEGAENGEKVVHMTDSGTIDFGTIRFERPDVFYYTLQETTDESGNFRRDRTTYHAALMADSNGDVKMVISTDNGSKTEKAAFTNSYKVEEGKSGNRKRYVPKTGDEEFLPWIFLMLAGALCLGSIIMRRRTGYTAEGQERGIHALRFAVATIIALFAVIIPACRNEAFALVSTTSDYSDLPVNEVEITDLDFNTAEFTSLDSRIQKGNIQYYLTSGTATHPTIYWTSTTAPKFGTTSATSTANAKLGSNTISGDIFTLRFSEGATLSDGTKKDILMTFSDLYFGLSKNTNGTTGSRYYYPLVRIPENGKGRYCNSCIGTSTKTSGRIKNVSCVTRIKTRIDIVEPGTTDIVTGKKYILGFRDLDIKDYSTATGSSVDRYAGHYSEGLGPVSGFYEPVYLSEDTLVRIDSWDGISKFRGTEQTDAGIASGLDISVSTEGFTYYWYGSYFMSNSVADPGKDISTVFGHTPTVSVYALSGAGGSIEKPGPVEYPVNSSTSYDYTPSPGYKVRSLIVDGSPVQFDSDGGTYVFEKLTETSEEDYDHTIEVQFHKPQDVQITKNVKGPLGDRNKMFEFTVLLAGLEEGGLFQITGDSTGTFTGVGSSGTYVSSKSFRSSSTGDAIVRLKMKDDQYIRFSSLTGGSSYCITEAASDHIPSFSISGSGANPVIAKASDANSGRGSLATRTETIDDGDGLVTVRFTNEKGMAAQTGVRSKRRPLVAAALVFVIAAALIFVVPEGSVLAAVLRHRRRVKQ